MARLVIKFSKGNRAKFISHLDTMRTLHRAFRRASLPIAYSKGFNPHASISVAAPLSLGIESKAEYADVDVDGEVDMSYLIKALNSALPSDLQIEKAMQVDGKMPSAMATVDFARYLVVFQTEYTKEGCNNVADKIMQSEEIVRMKRSKSGEKLVDIRPLIDTVIMDRVEDGRAAFECVLKSGSNGNLNIDAVVELLKEYSGGNLSGHAYVIREEIYTWKENRKIPLDIYFTRK